LQIGSKNKGFLAALLCVVRIEQVQNLSVDWKSGPVGILYFFLRSFLVLLA